MMNEETSNNPSWAEEAMVLAAACWRDEEAKGIQMDPVLAKAVAKRIEVLMETAAQESRNVDYYRSIVHRCGVAIGKRAFTQDDGGVVEEPLAERVAEIIEAEYGWGEER